MDVPRIVREIEDLVPNTRHVLGAEAQPRKPAEQRRMDEYDRSHEPAASWDAPPLPSDRTTARDGIEALAWYCPFHFWSKEKWGIYILDAGIEYLAAKLRPTSDALDAELEALRILQNHEFVHFATEIAISTIELDRRETLRTMNNLMGTSLFHEHFNETFATNSADVSEPLEEALGNAYAFERLDESGKHVIGTWMRTQPNGYRGFYAHLGPALDQAAIENLNRTKIKAEEWESSGEHDDAFYHNLSTQRELGLVDVPIRIVNAEAGFTGTLQAIQSIAPAQIKRTSHFKRDLKKLPRRVIEEFETNTLRDLASLTSARGLRFKQLASRNAFSFRVAGEYRAIGELTQTGEFVLTEIGHRKHVYD